MSECASCQQILSGYTGGMKCKLLRYRKYLIGIVIGAVLVFAVMKIRGKK